MDSKPSIIPILLTALLLGLIDGIASGLGPGAIVLAISLWSLATTLLALLLHAALRLALGPGPFLRIRELLKRTWGERTTGGLQAGRMLLCLGLATSTWAASSIGLFAYLIANRHGPYLIAASGLAGQVAIAAALTLPTAMLYRLLARVIAWEEPTGARAWLQHGLRVVPLSVGALSVAALLGAVVLYRLRETFALVDGPSLIALPALAFFLYLASSLWLVGNQRAARFGLVWGAALCVIAMIALLVVARAPQARLQLSKDAQTSRYLLSALQQGTDFDRDGSPLLPTFLDCAPFDRGRHPMAFDIPKNGIDEDCSGEDATGAAWKAPQASTKKRTEGPKPNLILITIDSLRSDHLGLYGYERDTSPKLDLAAKQAVIFDHAFSQDSGTGPSLWSMSVGKTPFQTSLKDAHRFPPKYGPGEVTLAERLKSYGYDTSAVVCGGVFRKWEIRRGFATYKEVCGRNTELSAARVSKIAKTVWASAKNKDKPQFLWVHYYDPHHPYTSHKQPSFGDSKMDNYDEEIRYADTHLAPLLRQFLTHKDRPTFVALTADHGENFGEHGRAYHARTLYREVTQVPFLFWGPGLVSRRVTAPVAINDIFPTFLDLAGADMPSSTTMASQAAVLFGAEPDPKRLVFQENSFSRPKRHVKAVVSQRHHMLYDLTLNTTELYDLSQDRAEKKNLVGAGLPEEATLRRALLDFIPTTHVPKNLAK